MATNTKINVITEILAELAVYQNPNLLLERFTGLLDTSKVNNADLKKYAQLLSNIEYVWKKTLRYEKYFADFYPSSEEISKIEALNYHIHSYLEDSTILMNKIIVLLNTMKNDIKKVASNKDQIKEFYDAGVTKTQEVFGGISRHRDPHHHSGMRFLDGSLLRAENAENTIKLVENPIFGEMVNPKFKSEFIAKQQKEKEESFDNAKTRWIEMARRNNEQSSGYLNALLDGIRPNLYDFLHIKRTSEIPGMPRNE